MNKNKLDLILGCMWSGKSTEAQRRIRRLQQIYKEEDILIISHSWDNRYGEQVISTHDKFQIKCYSINSLGKIHETNAYHKCKEIFIEEAQFFKGLKEFCLQAVDKDNKNVTVIGLDGDSNREPFGEILSLIPLADNYTKLKGLCKKCADGTEAIFTKRIVNNSNSQVLVGSEESFEAVCRYHYLN